MSALLLLVHHLQALEAKLLSFLVSCLLTVDFSLICSPGVSSGQSFILMIAVSPKLSLALKPNPKEKPGVMKQHFQGSSLANKEKVPLKFHCWE